MNNNPYLKTSMQFGAYSGLSSFMFFMILYFVNSNPLGNKGWLGFWIPILFIFLGTKFHRDKVLDNQISYGQAFGLGALIALCASLLYALLVFLFGTVADPSIVDNYKAEAMQGMEEARKYLSSEKLLSAMDEAASKIEEMKIGELAQSIFLNGLIGGALVSLISSAILKKKKPLFDEPPVA